MSEQPATMQVDAEAFSDLGLSLERLRALTMALTASEFFDHLKVANDYQGEQLCAGLTMLRIIFNEVRTADRLVAEAEGKAR